MTLSPKVLRFGVKAIVPYDRATKIPLGFSEVVSSGGLELAGEMISLHGGSNRYSYDTAHGYIEPKMTVNVKEFTSWIYTLMLGATPTTKDVSAAGAIENAKNETGTSLIAAKTLDATAPVEITTDGDLKFGKYVVVVDANSKLNVYVSSDVDAGVGKTTLTLFNDLLKINDDPLDFAGDVSIPQIGVTLNAVSSGFSTDDLVAGDSMTFEIIPKAKYFRRVTIGKNTDKFPVFGMYCISEGIRGSSLCLIDCFKCKANGFPQAFNEKSWAESELTIMPVTDGTNGVAEIIDLVRDE